MDPFSVSVGVIGLVGLAAKTIKITKLYVRGTNHAKEEADELLRELEVLYFNLTKLDKLLQEDPNHRFSDTSVLVTSTHACRQKLIVLHDKLEESSAQPLQRFRWPLSSKDHRGTLQELRAFAQWIQFALTIDGSSLLSKTSDEVVQVLSNQLRMFQLYDQLGTDSKHTANAMTKLQATLKTSVKANTATREATERTDILEWISKAKTEQKHHDVSLPRVEGTGDWLLQEPEFNRWQKQRSSNGNVLWCYGIQGSGKSVLADEKSHSIEHVTASLLKQILSAQASIPPAISTLYQKFSKQQRAPPQQDLMHALSAMCCGHRRVFIVVDALDECESKHRREFLKLLDELKETVNIFITSRPHIDDLAKIFEPLFLVEVKAHDSDLWKYIAQEIECSEAHDEIDSAFKEEIIEKVISRAQSMFLLAVSHVQTVLSEPTEGEMVEALEALPESLHAAFEETMQRIQRQPESRSRLALRSLLWLVYARRPLQFEELSDALAIKSGLTSVNPRYRPSQKTIVDCCHGLVNVDKESQTIRLVHYSVQQYLVDSKERFFPQGESEVARLCIIYQMLSPFDSGCRQTEDEIIDLLHDYPFLAYAAREWGFHVQAATDPVVDESTLSFLQARPQQACSYQVWQYTQDRREEYWVPEEANSCNGLHVASTFGLHDIAVRLLPEFDDIDVPTSMGTTALNKAASGGHRSLVRLFISLDASLTKNNWYGPPLHCAAEAGQVGTIDDILDAGVDVNLLDDHGRVALACAAASGHVNAMHALLDRGADINFICRNKGTTLLAAVESAEPPSVIRVLLERHADPNIPSVHGSVPLHIAARQDHEGEITRMLLAYGADVNARGENDRTALQVAAAANNIDALKLLLAKGAVIDAENQNGYTALRAAIFLGSVESVEILLEHGADPEIANELKHGRIGMRDLIKTSASPHELSKWRKRYRRVHQE
ncbi:MAG: hypothetical protein Q9220_001093 [cf. Caloplaca sp. 1 TL-2023]